MIAVLGIGPGLFFTGTDTGVGKTFVAVAIVRLLKRQGYGVRVCKPVASGAQGHNGRLVSEDSLALAHAAEDTDLEGVTPWAFADPVAPSVAARLQGRVLSLAELIQAVRQRVRPEHATLVEGVGGLLCPLTERELVADLAAALGWPLVVVARRSLGTLNHTLLTLEAAKVRGIQVAGIVINEAEQAGGGLAEETNIEELQRWTSVPVLAVVPHQGEETGPPASLAMVNWWRLCHLGMGCDLP